MTDDITSILLPASRIDVFALDDGTAKTAEDLSQDWRFARVEVDIIRNGIEAAVERYGQVPSPELIIIETNDISENFTAQLGALAEVCAEGTDAVIIGPTNDVHLYRSLVGMGVRDYLVRPISAEEITGVIAKALVEKRGLDGSRLVAVAGSKGGVGTTIVTQMLAWRVSDTLKQKTLLLDMAGSAGSLGVGCGLEPSTTLAEAVRVGQSGTDDDLKRLVQHMTDNLDVMVFGGDPLLGDRPDADSAEAFLDRVMKKYPVVVVDLSAAAPAIQKRVLARAAQVVVVSTPHITALRNCRTLLNEMKHLRNDLKNVALVMNKQGMPAADEVPLADIKKVLDLEPSASLPYAPKIIMGSETAGKPVGENKSAQDMMKALNTVAERAAGIFLHADAKGKKDGGFSLLRALGKGK